MLQQRESMTSLLHTRQPGGAMTVHDENSAQNLAYDEGSARVKSVSPLRKTPTKMMPDPRPFSCPTRKLRHNVDQKALLGHSMKLQEWLNESQVKSIQERTDKEANETKKMYNHVLGTEDTFVKDVDEFLKYNKLLDFRKKEVLHKQWNKSVFQPIHKEIEKEINGPNYTELSRRKRELHKEYLEHTNKKGHVFLDTIAPEEYYPMSLHPIRPSLLVAETRGLSDPLLSQQRARSAEERLIFRCMTGSHFTDRDLESMRLPPLPLVPQGRHGTTCNTWLEMPMGDIESPVRKASRRRMGGNYNDSQFAFSDWSRQFENRLVDDEMQLQRRRKCPTEHLVSKIAILNQHKQNKATQVPVAE